MSDLDYQNLSTVQSKQQPAPKTIASATTVAPTTLLTFITGTTDVATITPYVTGTHLLILKFTDASPPDLLDTGNIKVAVTTIAQNNYVILVYDPIAAKYEPIVEDTLASV